MTNLRSSQYQRTTRHDRLDRVFPSSTDQPVAGPSRLPAVSQPSPLRSQQPGIRRRGYSQQDAILVPDSDDERPAGRAGKATTSLRSSTINPSRKNKSRSDVQSGRGYTSAPSKSSVSSKKAVTNGDPSSGPSRPMPLTEQSGTRMQHSSSSTSPTRQQSIVTNVTKDVSRCPSVAKGRGTLQDPLEILSDSDSSCLSESPPNGEPRSLSKYYRASELRTEHDTPTASSLQSSRKGFPSNPFLVASARSRPQTPTSSQTSPTKRSGLSPSKPASKVTTPLVRARSGAFGSHGKAIRSTPPIGRDKQRLTPAFSIGRTNSPLTSGSLSRSVSPLKPSFVPAPSISQQTGPTSSMYKDSSSFKPAAAASTQTFSSQKRPRPGPSKRPRLSAALQLSDDSDDDIHEAETGAGRRTSPTTHERPKRARLDVGAYTIPTMDDPLQNWTTSQQSRNPKPLSTVSNTQPSGSKARSPTPKSNNITIPSNADSPLTPIPSFEFVSLPVEPDVASGDADSHDSEKVDRELSEETQPSHEEKESETDLLAQFEGFEFEAPVSPTASMSTIRRSASILLSPIQATRLPATPTHLRASQASQTNGTPKASCTPSKRLQSECQTPHNGSSDRRKAIRRDVDALLAEEDANRAAARAAAEKLREERQKALAALDDQDEESDEEHEQRVVVDDLFKSAPAAEAPSHNPQEGRFTRSKAIPTTPKQTKAQQLPYRAKPNADIEKLARANKRDVARGVSGADAERILAKLREEEGGSPEKDAPYPTPDSFPDHDQRHDYSSPEDLDGERLEVALRTLPKGTVDDELLKTLTDGKDTEADEEGDWVGFWQVKEMFETVDDDMVEAKLPSLNCGTDAAGDILKNVIRRNDIPLLSILLSEGLLHNIMEIGDNFCKLANGLFATVFNAVNISDADLANTTLHSLMSTFATHPFAHWQTFLHMIMTAWNVCGIHPNLLEEDFVPREDIALQLNRIEANLVIAELIAHAARLQYIDCSAAGSLATRLLVLSADPGTTHALKAAIELALIELWDIIAVNKHPLHIAKTISDLTITAPLAVQVRILVAVGTSTLASRNISRWLAAGYLLPETISALTTELAVPSFDIVYDAAVMLADEAGLAETDHNKLSHWIDLFWETMSDVPAFIEGVIRDNGDKAEEELDELRACLSHTHNKINVKPFSKSKDYLNKSRLSQIHVNTGYSFKHALVRRRRKDRLKMRDVEEGEGGQMRLSFGTAGKGKSGVEA